ncbi:MAG: Bug family tripartite tricarboxylate transporter substrate binding protein [Burkholderiales bacterium]
MKRIAFAAAAVAFSAAALAQSYPSRPVTIIAPASPGGNIDVTSRILAPALHEILGQPFVVENRPGAGGKIGATAALKAAPDGYTLMMGTSSTLSVGPNVYKEWPVDPVKGVTPISLVQQVPFALVVNARSTYKTVDDVLKQAKAKQGGMQMAHAGPGSSNHLVSELFQMLSGAKFLFVAYKGGAPAMASVVSGENEVYFDQASTSVIQVKAGRIRALAVTAEERFAPMPDVPTFDEAGIKGFHVMNVTGLVGPAGMPQAVVQRVNEATVKALKDPKVQERMKGIGAMIVGSNPQAFGKWIRGDLERWKKVVKEAKVPQL